MQKTRPWLIAAIMALLVLLVACGTGSRETGGRDVGTPAAQATGTRGSGSPAATQVRRGGTLTVALDGNPKTFDPMLANDQVSMPVVNNTFESLYKYDESLTPVPWLAERVEQPDNVTYVFHLRRDVTFHDGTPMDAEAVRFSIDRVRGNKASPRARDGQEIVESVVVDPYTYKIVLREPFAPFPSRLAGGLGAIVSPTAVQAMGDEAFGLNPVGTGPFRFGEWKSDSSVRVERFDSYWRQGTDGRPLPYLDRVEWQIIAEPANRLLALQSGSVDVVEAGRLRDQDLGIVKKDGSLTFKQQAGFSFLGLYLTINKPPFDNKALRQAVAYAIDRDEIVEAIYAGNREPAYGPIPPTLKWATDPEYKPYAYDPRKAKDLLAAAGRPDGFEFEYWIAAGDSQTQQLAELLQAQLARVGIKMKIESADPNGVIIPKLQKGESNAYQLGLSGNVDPDLAVSGSFQKKGGTNFFPYENDRVDQLIRQARQTSDPTVRAPLYREIVGLVMEDSPYIFTTYGVDRYVGAKNVLGWHVGQKAVSGYAEYWKSGE
jgi:peptide/nickel transport system substrate-binding protein